MNEVSEVNPWSFDNEFWDFTMERDEILFWSSNNTCMYIRKQVGNT